MRPCAPGPAQRPPPCPGSAACRTGTAGAVWILGPKEGIPSPAPRREPPDCGRNTAAAQRLGLCETVLMAWPHHPVLTLFLPAWDTLGAPVTLLGLGRARQASADLSGPGPAPDRQEGVLNTHPGPHSQPGAEAAGGQLRARSPPPPTAARPYTLLGGRRWNRNRVPPSLPGHFRKWIHLACGF